MAPDGAGAGTSGTLPLEDWIKRLNGADQKARKAIVEELAKALSLKVGDAYKKLQEAGWDPDAKAGEAPAAGNNPTLPPAPPTEKTSAVTLRHKTNYPHYRRSGLVLTGQWKPYTVTEAQRAALENDPWVEFQKPEGPAKK
jgi:hypothetical protein